MQLRDLRRPAVVGYEARPVAGGLGHIVGAIGGYGHGAQWKIAKAGNPRRHADDAGRRHATMNMRGRCRAEQIAKTRGHRHHEGGIIDSREYGTLLRRSVDRIFGRSIEIGRVRSCRCGKHGSDGGATHKRRSPQTLKGE